MAEAFEKKLAKIEEVLTDAHHPNQEALEDGLTENCPTIEKLRQYIQAKWEAQIIFEIFVEGGNPLNPPRFNSSDECAKKIEELFQSRDERIQRIEGIFAGLKEKYDNIVGGISV